MLNKNIRLCKSCNKRPPHAWRRYCLECIRKKEKELAMAKKTSEKQRINVKKEKITDKKRFSRSNLIKEADRVWSLYIRERDKWKPCITCWIEWTEWAQAGHFQSRRHINTRWEAQNGAGQCSKCNCWGCWEQYEFSLALNNRCPWLADQLRRLANDTSKTSDEEILTYIRWYYYELSQMGWSNEQIKIKKYYL